MKPSPLFDSSRQQWHERILRHFAGALSPEEQQTLNEALKESAELRREFALLALQQVQLGALREEMLEKIVALKEPTKPSPAVRPRWGKWAAAAAALALLGLLVFWPRSGSAPPAFRFATVQGEVWIQRGDTKRRATPGTALLPGELVQTAWGAEAVLAATREPTRLTLAEETTFALPAEAAGTFTLEAGTLSAIVAPQPRERPLRLRTPQAEARVIGTAFRVATDASATHLAVEDGSVELRRLSDGAAARVAAGQFAIAGESQPPVARPLPANGSGTGLLGEYFSWGQFERPTFRRLDPQVRFDWGTNRPGPGLNFDHFQVRWSGTVLPRFSERYTFELVADDGARLWVDGRLLIDQWVIRSRQTTMRGEISLEAGRAYALKLEYFESSGRAFVSLYWQSDSQPREIIPTTQLHPLATNAISSTGRP